MRAFAVLAVLILSSTAIAADSFYDRLAKIAKEVEAIPAGAKPSTATPVATELEAKAKSCKPNDLPCERETRRLATKLDASLAQDANMAKMMKETARHEKIEKIRAALMKQLNA